jgi:hypothetical protein
LPQTLALYLLSGLLKREAVVNDSDFKNGETLNVQSALAVFVVMMGFLFMIDAKPGIHMAIAGVLMLAGFCWYLLNHAYLWWRHNHPHPQRHH